MNSRVSRLSLSIFDVRKKNDAYFVRIAGERGPSPRAWTLVEVLELVILASLKLHERPRPTAPDARVHPSPYAKLRLYEYVVLA